MYILKKKPIVITLITIPLLCGAIIIIAAIQILNFETTTSHNADVAIILGAYTRAGKPSPVFEARINHGIQLYKTHRVKYLIFSGGTAEGEPISLA